MTDHNKQVLSKRDADLVKNLLGGFIDTTEDDSDRAAARRALSWLNAEGRRLVQAGDVPHWYRMDTPWPLHEVLKELIKGVRILLDEKDYDRTGHENMKRAQLVGEEILAELLNQAPTEALQPASPDKEVNDDSITQVSGFGVTNNFQTQCDYMLVGLTKTGRVVISRGDRIWADVSPITPSEQVKP